MKSSDSGRSWRNTASHARSDVRESLSHTAAGLRHTSAKSLSTGCRLDSGSMQLSSSFPAGTADRRGRDCCLLFRLCRTMRHEVHKGDGSARNESKENEPQCDGAPRGEDHGAALHRAGGARVARGARLGARKPTGTGILFGAYNGLDRACRAVGAGWAADGLPDNFSVARCLAAAEVATWAAYTRNSRGNHSCSIAGCAEAVCELVRVLRCYCSIWTGGGGRDASRAPRVWRAFKGTTAVNRAEESRRTGHTLTICQVVASLACRCS